MSFAAVFVFLALRIKGKKCYGWTVYVCLFFVVVFFVFFWGGRGGYRMHIGSFLTVKM